jgi:Capsule polysaccharide biosynthesis protein
VYFPLHVTDDYKIERIIPHCSDQEYLIRQVADALPQGHDLVLKEHPHSLGRNPVSMLRRLSRLPNVHLVDPYASSHELMRSAQAMVVISSTVGLEALFYGKPVLTLGRPYYAGYGVTLDVESFRDIHSAVPAVLSFRPDRERILAFLHACMRSTYEGDPVWADTSDANARKIADSLELAARRHAGREAGAVDEDALVPLA